MEKINFLVIALVCFTVFTAGCLGGEEEPDPKKKIVSLVKESKTGYATNPDFDSSAPDVNTVFNFTIPPEKGVAMYYAQLTWVDDHQGSDSQDTYDEFEITISAGNRSATASSSTGSVYVLMGEENIDLGQMTIDLNNNTLDLDLFKDDYIPFNNSYEITITMKSAGTYGQLRPGGVLRAFDTGNDWQLQTEAYVVEWQ